MTNWYVSPTGNDITGNGTVGNPYQTIQGTHDKAGTVNGDTIVLLPGTYTYSSTVTLTKSVSLTSQSGNYVDTIVNFTTSGTTAGINYASDTISGINISNITFTTSETNDNGLIRISFTSNGSTKPLSWPTNIKIFGNKIQGTRDAIRFNGENMSIYKNIFERSPINASGQVQPIVMGFFRGELLFDGNTLTDTVAAPEVSYFGTLGGTTTPYVNYTNSKNGTITMTNNTILYTNSSPTFITQLVKHERWNIFSGSEALDGLTAALVAAYRVNYYISNNTVSLTNSAATEKRLRPVIFDATPANDGAGNSVLNQIGFVYFENNVFSTTPGLPSGGVSEGYITIAGSNNVSPTNLNTPTFFFRDNSAGIISVPFPRSVSSVGDIYFTQRTTVTPANMYLNSWITRETVTPPVFDPATYNFFNLPVNMILDISGLVYAPLYRSNVEEPVAGVTTHDLFETEATQILVSGLPVNAFKVIVGTAPSGSSNSLWFFIRVYDDAGAIITSFPTPITIELTTNTITGANATVKLNGSTLTTTATEVSTGVYVFNLSSNSEYLIEGEQPAEPPLEDRFSDRGSVEWRREACILSQRIGRFASYADYVRSKRCSRICC
jgi:hypothetical protein